MHLLLYGLVAWCSNDFSVQHVLGVSARGGEGGEPRHGGKRQTYLWKEDAGMDVGPDALAKGQPNGPL